jgi:uncharacterized membrane protein
VLIFALLFLYFGNKIASGNLTIFEEGGELPKVEATVINILDEFEESDEWHSTTTITFEAAITETGQTVTAAQTLGGYIITLDKGVEAGDKVILIETALDEWHFMDYIRIDKMIILGAAFIALLLFFGRVKGLNAILSLGLTCVAIFAVFIPSILSGKNIYASTIIVCIYAVTVTIFLIIGINKQAFAAIAGCFGGVIAAGLITLIMSKALLLTGIVDDDSTYLLYLPTEIPIDLKAIIFAGIIIGAVGAIMDVAVSISAALWELKMQAPKLTFKELYKSGGNIGRDIMGSMTTTLVLAYIGSSLSIILILIVYASSFIDLVNRELVIVELLQAIVGSMGLLLTIPLTALISAALFTKTPAAPTATKGAAVEIPTFTR